MLENLGLVVAVLLTMLGALLLFGGTDSASNASAALRLIGGAAALAAGFITVAHIVRSNIIWRRIQRQNRDHV